MLRTALVLLALVRPVLADPPIRYELVESWDVDSASEVLVGRPVDAVWHPRGPLLVLDGQLERVHVFDADGVWLRSFGDEGGGPGEFRGAGALFCDTDGTVVVVQGMPLRLVRFALDGEVLPEAPFDDGVEGFRLVTTMRAAGEHLVFEEIETVFGGGMQAVSRLVAFDRSVGAREVLAEHTRRVDRRAPFHEHDTAPFLDAWCVTAGNRVVYVDDFSAHRARVVDLEGELVHALGRDDVEAVPRTGDEVEAVRSRHRARLAPRASDTSRFEPSPMAPTLVDAFAREDGEVWLRRHVADRDHGTALRFDRFDRDGVFRGEIVVEGPTRLHASDVGIDGDRVVVLSGPEEDGPLITVFRLRPGDE